MTMSCCPHNVSTLALNVSRRVVLLSVNVSWENGCLQAEPFMFASSYNYEDPGQGSIAYGDMAAIQIQDPRAQSGRSHRCPAKTNANVCFECLWGKAY